MHYLFGSRTSLDTDIMIVIDKMPATVKECQELCKKHEEELQPDYDKKVNTNLCVIEDGIVVDVFKGTVDEVNNSVYRTYDFHQQKFPLKIEVMVQRDVGLKFMRAARIILSFLSRTEHRKEVKRALRGDFNDKLDVLESIDLSAITDLGTKKVSLLDFRKMMVFQLGQAHLLAVQIQAYTKGEVANVSAMAYNALFRKEMSDFELYWLRDFQSRFIYTGRALIPNMKTLKE
jgi:hypothetical protein